MAHRVLVAKPGLDGHDRGAKIIARALRDAGFEVIYTGLHQTPAMIARAAVDEAVDAVGLSILSGAHLTLLPQVVEAVHQEGVTPLFFAGGVIPEGDIPALESAGYARIFTPGSDTRDVARFLQESLDS